MALPFQIKDREKFAKTFLKEVKWIVSFPEFDFDEFRKKDLIDFLKTNFNLDHLDADIEDGVTVKSRDELIKFNFARDFASVKIKYPAYNSLENSRIWLDILLKYLHLMQCESIVNLTVKKCNELGYELPSNDIAVVVAMRELFSAELLSYDDNDKEDSEQFDNLSRWEKHIDFCDESCDNLAIDYGFCHNLEKKTEGVLTLNLVVRHTLNNANMEDIKKQIYNSNLIIDNAFAWCINDDVLEKMRKDE